MRTSVPWPAEPLSSKASESAAISGRPRPSAGGSARAGRGWMPAPWSRTTIVEPGLVGEHLDLEHARVLVVGVHDDVGAGLGDGHLHVGQHGGVEVQRVGHSRERLAHDADALRARRHGQQDLRRGNGHSLAPLVERAAAIASSRPCITGRTGTRPVMSRIRWTPGSTLSPTQTT